MLRFSSRRLLGRTFAVLSAQTKHGLPDGFEFLPNKVVDKDIHANYENLESLKLTMTRQDEVILKETPVRCVTITTVNGQSGIYPCHAYEIAKLVPSPITLELMNGTVKRYFTSGGFAHINNEGSCDINCVECIPFAELDLGAAEKALAEQRASLATAKDEKARSVVEIRVDVLESVIQALKQHQA